jgi:hypothetical protein
VNIVEIIAYGTLCSGCWITATSLCRHKGRLTAEGCIGKLITWLAKRDVRQCTVTLWLRGKSLLRRRRASRHFFEGKAARLQMLESSDRRSLEELTVGAVCVPLNVTTLSMFCPRRRRAPDACPTYSRSLQRIHLIPASLSKRAFMWVAPIVMQK